MENTPYKLYLDDERTCPWTLGNWETARSFEGFCNLIRWRGVPEMVSFDHDLADEHYAHFEHPIPYTEYAIKTGYDCAKWLRDWCQNNALPLPKWAVHSLNPAGKQNIERVLSRQA